MSDATIPDHIKLPPKDVYAFPLHASIGDGNGGTYYATSAGMKLRDYFAGQALAGLLADPSRRFVSDFDRAAEAAYALASAMMKARDK